MVATLCLFTCALAAAQAGGGADWPLVPRLNRGQELIYSGTYAEEINGPTVQYTHAYRLETRVFVLETSGRGSEVAFLTILRPKAVRPEGNTSQLEPNSVRLELATVDAHGRVGSEEVNLAIPLNGPPVLETGAFVEMPGDRVRLGQSWEVMGNGRPPTAWKVAGREDVSGTPCVKLEGVQQSEDWDKPRADRTAWRRRDAVWIAPTTGVAMKFERLIEHREPLRRDPNHHSLTSYVLDNRVQYPAQLYEDRKREIALAQALSNKAKVLMREPEKAGRAAFEEILARINHHLENQPTTPYRESLVQFKRRMEAAQRGEFPPASAEETRPVTQVIALGQPAPDFVSTELGTQESARLHRLLGKPVVLVFYSPASRTARDLLPFAQSLWTRHKGEIKVIGLAVSEDTAPVLKQRDELHLTFPILSGLGLRMTYAIDATPKVVVLDAKGVVRGAYVGWGKETPTLITEELDRWIRAASPK